MRYFKKLYFIWIAITILVTMAAVATANGRHRVLVLHSYDQNLLWVDAITKGIIERLPGNRHLEIFFDDMDTKRFDSQEYLNELAEFYNAKYKDAQPDVIISSDNNAFNFLRARRDELFPGVPIVFCGLNGFSPAMLEGFSLVTGVAETVSFRETLEAALKIHPDARQIVVYSDGTPTFDKNKESLLLAAKELELSTEISFIENLTISGIREHSSKLSPDSFIVVMSGFRSDTGMMLSFQKGAKLLSEKSAVPIYSCWEFFLGHGIVGGKLISGREQGLAAGEIAWRIIHGESADTIPVVTQSPNVWKFDHIQLKRFGIDEDMLPAGSNIINKPVPLHEAYPEIVWAIPIALISILFFIVINVVHTKRLLNATNRTMQISKDLSSSKARLQRLFSSAAYGIVIADPDTGIISECNDALAKMLKFEKSQIVGRRQSDLHPPGQSADEANCAFKAQLGEREGESVETQMVTSTGEVIDVEITARRVDLGNKIVVQGFFHDVTDRKKAEAAARMQEERFEVFFRSANDAIFVHSLLEEGFAPFGEVNDTAYQRYGYTRDEFTKLTASDITATVDDENNETAIVRQRLHDTGHVVFETVHIKKSGETFPVEINSNVLLQFGRPKIMDIVRDISERKVAEEERSRLEWQLHQFQKMEAVGTLAGGIAHDFNNILGAILGYTELTLRDELLSRDSRDNLKEVLQAGKRAKELTRQILTYSRNDKMEKEPVQLHLIVKEAAALLRKTIPSSIRINLDVDHHTGVVEACVTQLQQMVMNLCVNAQHAIKDGNGEISISLEPVDVDRATAEKYPMLEEGPHALLTVKDTGEGISPTIISRIFDPFFTTKKQGSGKGMGLSIVHGIVQHHGGAIGVESDINEGTTFKVFIPLMHTDESPTADPEATPKTGTEHILFVDDEMALVRLGKRTLENLGYRVSIATSPQKALEMFRSAPDSFDLVITDLAMPAMSGDILAREVMDFRPGFPVIICTGYSDVLDEKTALAMGVRAFLMKPLVGPVLSDEIRRILD